MNYRLLALTIALGIVSYACKMAKPVKPFDPARVQAKVAEEGLLTCFAPVTSSDGKPVWCEASAVLFDGRTVWVANDKDMPSGQSSVFRKDVTAWSDTTQMPTYRTEAAYLTGRKYEDFTQTPDGKFVFLTTAFDRVKPDSPDWDAYNTILYWRKGDEQHPHVLMPSGQYTTSVGFRRKLAQVLATDASPGDVQPAGIPYFKIEGLAATDKQLLFGIRETGKAFDNFTYVNKIVAVSYTVGTMNGEDRIQLFDDWRVLGSFDPALTVPSLPKPLGLSSLEYDPIHHCLWMMTSYEKDGKLDAYVWTNTLADLNVGKPFRLVRNGGRKPLQFGHKAEDMTFLDANRLLIIHDDDRVQTLVGSQTRQPNQAAYTILTVN